jgi:hypothetical protein
MSMVLILHGRSINVYVFHGLIQFFSANTKIVYKFKNS